MNFFGIKFTVTETLPVYRIEVNPDRVSRRYAESGQVVVCLLQFLAHSVTFGDYRTDGTLSERAEVPITRVQRPIAHQFRRDLNYRTTCHVPLRWHVCAARV